MTLRCPKCGEVGPMVEKTETGVYCNVCGKATEVLPKRKGTMVGSGG